jgi:hypothetical protein
MKSAIGALLAVPALAFAAPARAESILMACQVSTHQSATQEIVLEIRDGSVRYGSTMSDMVDALSLSRSSLVVTGETIGFKQVFPSSKVTWDWRIDRGSGTIIITYLYSGTGKSFLHKTGSCRSM